MTFCTHRVLYTQRSVLVYSQRTQRSSKRQGPPLVFYWDAVEPFCAVTFCKRPRVRFSRFPSKLQAREAMFVNRDSIFINFLSLTLSRPREMANFSKSLTMNWETTCDIPFKDGAYYCYCAYVLRIWRYSGFLWVVPTNTGIFLPV